MSLRVHIVDDEPPARERLSSMLAEVGDFVLAGEAGNGEQAIDMVDRLTPDIVLLDVRMPGIDGLEVARHLAALPAPPAVIFTTAFDEYALQAFDSEAVAYLLKPIRAEKLRADGVRVALASNCSRRYLESFLAAFELDGAIDEARCAESPGIRSKGDMIREILGNFGTRKAVMIGDRESDREAAAQNRIPFILFTGGFGGPLPLSGERAASDYREVRRALEVRTAP